MGPYETMRQPRESSFLSLIENCRVLRWKKGGGLKLGKEQREGYDLEKRG